MNVSLISCPSFLASYLCDSELISLTLEEAGKLSKRMIDAAESVRAGQCTLGVWVQVIQGVAPASRNKTQMSNPLTSLSAPNARWDFQTWKAGRDQSIGKLLRTPSN